MGNLTVRVEVDSDLVERALRRLGSEAKAALAAGMAAAGEVIATAADERLGAEANVVEVEARPTNVRIGPEEELWFYRFLEYGVGPHVIRPDVKKALMIVPGVLRGRVMHPGFGARPYLRPALDERMAEALREAGKAVRDALDDV